MGQRIRTNRAVMRQRKEIVEHPFGTMKRGMQQGDFLMRGLQKVSAEMSLTVLAYNLKRVFTIMGVRKLLDALRDGRLKKVIPAVSEAMVELQGRIVLNMQLSVRVLLHEGGNLFGLAGYRHDFSHSLRAGWAGRATDLLNFRRNNVRCETSRIFPHHPMTSLWYDRYLNTVFWQYPAVFIRQRVCSKQIRSRDTELIQDVAPTWLHTLD